MPKSAPTDLAGVVDPAGRRFRSRRARRWWCSCPRSAGSLVVPPAPESRRSARRRRSLPTAVWLLPGRRWWCSCPRSAVSRVLCRQKWCRATNLADVVESSDAWVVQTRHIHGGWLPAAEQEAGPADTTRPSSTIWPTSLIPVARGGEPPVPGGEPVPGTSGRAV